jgi:hypothetical protein
VLQQVRHARFAIAFKFATRLHQQLHAGVAGRRERNQDDFETVAQAIRRYARSFGFQLGFRLDCALGRGRQASENKESNKDGNAIFHSRQVTCFSICSTTHEQVRVENEGINAFT